MLRQLQTSLAVLLVLTLLLGFLYPLAVTGIARVFFPGKAEGSLVRVRGGIVGSALVGQSFSDPKWFWGRPTSTGPIPFDASRSGGSNLGPTNPALGEAVRARIARL